MNDVSLRHDAWNAVYEVLNNNKNSMITGKSVTILGGYPDEEPVFPCVIINPVSVNEDEYTIDTTRSVSSKEVVVVLELFTKSNLDLDYLGDAVSDLFRSNQLAGLFLISVSDSNAVFLSNNNKLKQRTISLVFRRR